MEPFISFVHVPSATPDLQAPFDDCLRPAAKKGIPAATGNGDEKAWTRDHKRREMYDRTESELDRVKDGSEV